MRILILLFILLFSIAPLPISAAKIIAAPDGTYYNSETKQEYTKEQVQKMVQESKKKQAEKNLLYADIAGLVLFLLIAMWAYADWNSKFSKVVYGCMFRYISIAISGLALCVALYEIATTKSSRTWEGLVLTSIIFINLLALLKLDPSAKSISSYISTFVRRIQIENEMKTLEAEKKLDELRK